MNDQYIKVMYRKQNAWLQPKQDAFYYMTFWFKYYVI